MQSDTENKESKTEKPKVQRMSQLSKLNLLGLINLSEIVCDLKQNGNIDEAIAKTTTAIKELYNLSQEMLNQDDESGFPSARFIGIAS